MPIKWDDIKQILEQHDFRRHEPAATPWYGMLMGNADMGTVIFGPSSNLSFRLNKMDLWDARMNIENLNPILPLSEFKSLIFHESKKIEKGGIVKMKVDKHWEGEQEIFPCMRTGFDFMLRVNRGEQSFPVLEFTQSIRLQDASYRAEFPVVWWPGYPSVTAEAFIHWNYNLLALKLDVPDCSFKFDLNSLVTVSFFRDPFGGRSWDNLSAGPSLRKNGIGHWKRDPRAGALPPAEYSFKGNTGTIRQVIPGDAHSPERGFSGAVVCAEGGEFFREPSGHIIMEGASVKSNRITFFVSLASDMEGPDADLRAMEMVQMARSKGYDELYAEHAVCWKNYWLDSMVCLADKNLERVRLRDDYRLAITARSGRPAPCITANTSPVDCPPWRGDRHNDYPEYSGSFWASFSSNHREQALNYTEFVHGYLPTARRIASEVYECEKGAAYPCTYIDGTDIYYFHQTWGRILWLTAGHAQNCWWHYQYFGDKKFLSDYAYPVMKECADFYSELLKKNSPGDYTFWPTIACEIRGWTKDFELNKNCIEDLAHIKFLLRGVIEASTILKKDRERRERWQEMLNNMPDYPVLEIDGKEEFVDFAGQDERPKYNHSVPLAPLWPAEDPDVINNPRLRQIAENTLHVHPWDNTRLMIAFIRLGMKEEVYKKMLDKDVKESERGISLFSASGSPGVVVNEMLLTSWDGIIRIFPSWPLDRKAVFRRLRAKGAFLVSASCGNGDIETLTIESEAGNTIRILSPWARISVLDRKGNKVAVKTIDNDVLEWDTVKGGLYTLQKKN